MSKALIPESFFLKELTQNDEYSDLRDFFLMSWEKSIDSMDPQYRYTVYFAQKCQNLNELFYSLEFETSSFNDACFNLEALSKVRKQKFLSQDGLFLKAEELADSFIEKGAFPNILVLDELAIFGRDFCEFFYSLERRILEIWKAKTNSELTDIQYFTLHNKLAESIDFYTYRLTKHRNHALEKTGGLLVDNILGACLKGVFKRIHNGECCSFMQLLYKVIYSDQHIDNSSYFPTLVLGKKEYNMMKEKIEQERSWNVDRWRYHGRNTWIWSKQTSVPGGLALYPLLACRMDADSDCVYLTPYLFAGNLTKTCSDYIIGRFVGFLSQNSIGRCDYFLQIFQLKYESYLDIKLKLAFSLLSLIFALEFFDDANQVDCFHKLFIDSMLVRARIEKLCESFGGIDCAYDSYIDFVQFIATHRIDAIAFQQELNDILLTNNTWIEGEDYPKSLGINDAYILQAEKYFVNLDLQKHKQIKRKIDENSVFVANSIYRLPSSLSDYCNSFGTDYQSTRKKLSVLVVMLEHGIIGNDIYQDNGEFHYFKVGEAVTHISAQHLYRFIPVLASLERICLNNGLTFEVWAQRFGNYLNEHLANCDADFGELFWHFSNDMYMRGYRIEDWNLGDVYDLDLPSFDASTEVRTLKEWNSLPWTKEEQENIQAMNREQYISWELAKQAELWELLVDFFAEIAN